MAVSASLVVRFTDGTSAEGRITAEIDNRPNGLNAGKTSFGPGDSVGFLVYPGPNVKISRVLSTLGAIKSEGNQSVDIEEFIQFPNTKEASMRAPANGGVSGQWLGTDGGAYTIADGLITLPTEAVAMLHLLYNAEAQGYRLTNVPQPSTFGLTDLEVLIYIEGTLTDG